MNAEVEYLKNYFSICKKFVKDNNTNNDLSEGRLKDCYVRVSVIDQNIVGKDYIEEFNVGNYSMYDDKRTITKDFKNIKSAISYTEKQMAKDNIDDVEISIRVNLFSNVKRYSMIGFTFVQYLDPVEMELAYFWGWDTEHPIMNEYVKKFVLDNVGKEALNGL